MVDPPKVVNNPSINWTRRSLANAVWQTLLPLGYTKPATLCQTITHIHNTG